MGLHGVEGGLVDQRRHGDGYHFADGLQFLGFRALIKLVASDIGRASQDAVNLPDAPAPAVTGEKSLPVEVGSDVLHAHRSGCSIPFQGKSVDQPHRVGVQRVDFQLLLDLRAALLGRDHAVADGRQGAIPKALARVLLQGAQHMLGVFLGLVFVEQRHDLPHHDVHGIVAHFLGNRDQLDAVLRQLPDVEFQFEMVAEEAAERMDDHHIERRGLARARLDHALEFRAAVIGGGRSRLNVGLGELVAARLAIRLALPLLVGN